MVFNMTWRSLTRSRQNIRLVLAMFQFEKLFEIWLSVINSLTSAAYDKYLILIRTKFRFVLVGFCIHKVCIFIRDSCLMSDYCDWSSLLKCSGYGYCLYVTKYGQ